MIKHVSLDVLLKNANLLKDICQQIDKHEKPNLGVMNMFEENLQQPIKNLHYYSFLMRVLIGKNRYPHSSTVVKILENTHLNFGDIHSPEFASVVPEESQHPRSKLLLELLAAYLILLN